MGILANYITKVKGKNDIFTKIINLNPSTWSLRSKNLSSSNRESGVGGASLRGLQTFWIKTTKILLNPKKNRGIIYYAVSSDEIVAHLTGQAARSCGSENEEDICVFVLVGCSGIF
jgi:hypothetical protein